MIETLKIIGAWGLLTICIIFIAIVTIGILSHKGPNDNNWRGRYQSNNKKQ